MEVNVHQKDANTWVIQFVAENTQQVENLLKTYWRDLFGIDQITILPTIGLVVIEVSSDVIADEIVEQIKRM